MSQHHLRKDNHCQNCGAVVTIRFCSACGQENVETRQSFGHLVRHFVEDFTHYEGSFWKTIQYLLFRPAYLTQTYLSGKRVRYVAPVKLYIFVSFISFFLFHVLPDFNTFEPGNEIPDKSVQDQAKGSEIDQDLLLKNSLQAYDSLQHSLADKDKDGAIMTKINKELIYINYSSEEKLNEELSEKFEKISPKALFVFMPLFAFILWLFHNKKKYYYFDHGIFTLHYFSFVLIVTTLNFFLSNILPWSYLLNSTIVTDWVDILSLSWIVYYFFRAHYRMYPSAMGANLLKASGILMIELILLSVLFLLLLVYSLSYV